VNTRSEYQTAIPGFVDLDSAALQAIDGDGFWHTVGFLIGAVIGGINDVALIVSPELGQLP